MAKDGTNRGGNRIGSGRKPTKKSDKNPRKSNKKLKKPVVLDAVELEGIDMPPVSEFMKAKQKDGKDLFAEEVFKETWLYLVERGCEKLVSKKLIEQYAMSVSRWIQCEEGISEYGFLAKHPTTGGAIASPYVAMCQNFIKQVNQSWLMIYQIIKDNSSYEGGRSSSQDELMERIITRRRT